MNLRQPKDIVRTNLTSTRWRFASNQAVLNRLSDAPTGRFNAAYQLPENLFVHAVTVNDFAIEYNIPIKCIVLFWDRRADFLSDIDWI